MSRLLDWEEARDRVLAGVSPLAPVRIPTIQARGETLAETVIAAESLPPFDNTAMDGFAVRAADVIGATPLTPILLQVVGEVAAGAAVARTMGPGEAIRIMTGAPIPGGADAIVPVESTNFWDPEAARAVPDREGTGRVEIRSPAKPGAHIRSAGEVLSRGDTALEAGSPIGPGQLGLLLSAGVLEVNVHPLPRVGVFTTGNEVGPPDRNPGPAQIRDSNRPSLLAALAAHGFPTLDLGIVSDQEPELRQAVQEALPQVDFLLTSGGVSVGDYDLTRQVLTDMGEVQAYRVAVKPGKPQVFGQVQGTPVFGLPGNPVSSLVVFDQFVLPALKKMAGRPDPLVPWFSARLSAPISRKPGRVEFLRVRLEIRDGEWWVTSAGGQGSHDLATLSRANGYARLERETERLEAGSWVPSQLLGATGDLGTGSQTKGNAVG